MCVCVCVCVCVRARMYVCLIIGGTRKRGREGVSRQGEGAQRFEELLTLSGAVLSSISWEDSETTGSTLRSSLMLLG